MAGECRSDDTEGKCSPRPFAKAHVELQNRLLADRGQKLAMARLGAGVADEAVVQQRRVSRVQNGGGRRTDEAVENDRDTRRAGRKDGPADRRLFTPAECCEDGSGVTLRSGMAFQAPLDGVDLSSDSGRIRACSGSDPIGDRPAETCAGESGGDGGIADAHFAEDQDVRALVHGGGTAVQCIEAFDLAHRGASGEITGWLVQIEGDHVQIRAVDPAKLVDRGSAVLEVRNHLDGHFLWIGIDALRADAVVAGKDQCLRPPDFWSVSAAPCGHELRNLFQSSERPRRLGQAVLARPRGFGGGLVCRRKAFGQRLQIGQRGQGKRRVHVI